MHVFLISMPVNSPRRQSGLRQIKATGLSFEIVDGVQARLWRKEELPCEKGSWLKPGEVGCYLAHLHALQRIVDYEMPWACVLEDDFCYEPDPDFGLVEIESYLPTDFDYVHLQRDCGWNPDFKVLEGSKYFERIHGTPWGTVGYLISQRLCRRILRDHTQCELPIDKLFDQLSPEGIFYRTAKPLVGAHDGFGSDVHGT